MNPALVLRLVNGRIIGHQTQVPHFTNSSPITVAEKQTVDTVVYLRFKYLQPLARPGLRCERVARTPSQPE